MIASEVGVAGVDRADVVESGRVGPGQMLVVDTGLGHRPRRSRGQAAAGAAPALPALAGREQGVPRGHPAPRPGADRRPTGCAACARRSATRRRSWRSSPRWRRAAASRRVDGRRHAAGGAVRPAAAAVRLLQAALRPGHEPADRPPARGAGDDAAHVDRRDRQPARRAARPTAAGWRCRGRYWTGSSSPSCGSSETSRSKRCRRSTTRRRSGCPGARDRRALPSSLPRRGEGRPSSSCPTATSTRSTRRSRRCWRPRPSTRTSSARAPAPLRPGGRVGRAARVDALRAAARLRGGRRAPLPGAGRAGRRGAARATSAPSAEGLLKICSKMGISTVQSYRGAQIFEAVGLGPRLVARYFPGTVSRIGGIEADDVSRTVALLHARALRRRPAGRARRRVPAAAGRRAPRLGSGLDRRPAARRPRRQRRQLPGVRGRPWTRPPPPPPSAACSSPARSARRCRSKRSSRSASLVRRFASGAMSLGSIRPEAHETLAVAMNRIGGRSNTGEGGEDPARSVPDPDGDLRRSAIKQVASGRFGVTAAYLVDADQLQIKIAQGAKPGEGGQLPGHKVDATDRAAAPLDARRRPDLASAAPRHLLDRGPGPADPRPALREPGRRDLGQAGRRGRASAPIAAGVAKARADHIVIAGHDGGTGASPLSSIKHAGLPWELGLAETQQVLVGKRPARPRAAAGRRRAAHAPRRAGRRDAGRGGVRVLDRSAGRRGLRDDARLPPEHLPGRASRRRIPSCGGGSPARPSTSSATSCSWPRACASCWPSWARARLDELVGRGELLAQVERARPASTSRRFWQPAPGRGAPRSRSGTVLGAAPIVELIARAAPGARARQRRCGSPPPSRTRDRSVGRALAGEIARRHGDAGLPAGAIRLELQGVAGQSLGAFAPRGLELRAGRPVQRHTGQGPVRRAASCVRSAAPEGRPPPATPRCTARPAGELFVRGSAGERFAVRNSGATAVVEGCGDHGCEYMTGGTVLVLGATGRNFAAGMSGGARLPAGRRRPLRRTLQPRARRRAARRGDASLRACSSGTSTGRQPARGRAAREGEACPDRF